MKVSRLIPVILILCAIATPAIAMGHDPDSRKQTLAQLQQEVETVCPWYAISPRCREIKSLVRNLYQFPDLARQDDLATLDRLAELGQDTGSSRVALAQAISETRAIFAHVINDHGVNGVGFWEPNICLPATSS